MFRPKARRTPRFGFCNLSSQGFSKMLAIIFPITCPECREESLSSVSAAMIDSALSKGEQLTLHSSCHATDWPASHREMEQIKEYLWAAQIA
jgi:hypothetical protein